MISKAIECIQYQVFKVKINNNEFKNSQEHRKFLKWKVQWNSLLGVKTDYKMKNATRVELVILELDGSKENRAQKQILTWEILTGCFSNHEVLG